MAPATGELATAAAVTALPSTTEVQTGPRVCSTRARPLSSHRIASGWTNAQAPFVHW